MHAVYWLPRALYTRHTPCNGRTNERPDVVQTTAQCTYGGIEKPPALRFQSTMEQVHTMCEDTRRMKYTEHGLRHQNYSKYRVPGTW